MKTLIMKNTIQTISKKLFFFCISMMITALISCSNENEEPDLDFDEKASANDESLEEYYFSDAGDIAMEAFVNEDESQAGGKLSTDSRLSGAIILRTGPFISGNLRIDFGNGCVDIHGNLRKGLIIIDHVGRWNVEGSQWIITFSGYTINGIKIEGTKQVTVMSVTAELITRDVKLLNGRITWPDGSVATRECHYIRERERHENHLLDRLIVYGNAQGTFRTGRGFSIEILERLIYDRTCVEDGVFIPVQGKKLIKHGERELTVDYGDGACDNIVSLTNKAGVSIRYEFSK
jgi:hypothetical protein